MKKARLGAPSRAHCRPGRDSWSALGVLWAHQTRDLAHQTRDLAHQGRVLCENEAFLHAKAALLKILRAARSFSKILRLRRKI